MASLKVPILVVVLGEGGSGGALAIGIGDRVFMMENSVYSVISPEGCAAILWKDAGQAARAADCLRLTAIDLLKFGLIDQIIPESSIWALDSTEQEKKNNSYTEFDLTSKKLKKVLLQNLKELREIDDMKRILQRYQKFRLMGEWLG